MIINQINNQTRFIDYIETYKKKYDKIFLLTQKSIIQHYPFMERLDINILICRQKEACKSIEEYEERLEKKGIFKRHFTKRISD